MMAILRDSFLSGYSIPRKKIPIPKVKNPDKIPNPGDFAKIPEIKIPNPGDKKPKTKKIGIPGIKIPRLKKIPKPGDKIPGISSLKNPEY